MSSPSDYVSVEDAGKLLGVSARTIRNWIASGKLPAIAGNRGRLVARADVLRIGSLTGKLPEDAERVSVSETSSESSSAELPEASSVTAIVTAREQLEAIRDEWLAPLVAQITDQAETIGRLTAERDALQSLLDEGKIQPTSDPLSTDDRRNADTSEHGSLSPKVLVVQQSDKAVREFVELLVKADDVIPFTLFPFGGLFQQSWFQNFLVWVVGGTVRLFVTRPLFMFTLLFSLFFLGSLVVLYVLGVFDQFVLGNVTVFSKSWLRENLQLIAASAGLASATISIALNLPRLIRGIRAWRNNRAAGRS